MNPVNVRIILMFKILFVFKMCLSTPIPRKYFNVFTVFVPYTLTRSWSSRTVPSVQADLFVPCGFFLLCDVGDDVK